MFRAFLAWLRRWFAESVQPPPPPVPVPVPVPTPPPVPVPVLPPVPPSPPVHGDQCPQPIGIKLNFRPDARKLARGYRNMADITPLVKGACLHKNNPSPDAVCAVSEACGEVYNTRYGQPEAFQTGPGFYRHPVERSSANPYMLVFATNSESEWDGGRYKPAGKMTIGVSMSCLNFWRCQDVEMDSEGRIVGFGSDLDAGYNVTK